MKLGEGAEHSSTIRMLAVLYFMGSSMLVQFTTKAIFTTYNFHFPLTMATLQMVFIAPVAYLIARPPLTWELVSSLVPLAVVNVLNVVCGLVGTQGLNLPMFIALRRFTLLFTILLERFWLRKTHEWATIAAMTLMIGGALLAAATDLTFSARGYVAVLANDALTSLYLIMVKNRSPAAGLSTTGMLFYNSALSLPILALALWARGEPGAVAVFPLLGSARFQLVLFLASALGLSINHSTFVCTRVNEPLMTSVAGNLKNIIMTLLGAVMFGDFVFRGGNAAGLALSMAGAIWYATRSAFKARQRSIKDSLLQHLPVIGRDRLKGRASAANGGAHHHHARSGSLSGAVSGSAAALVDQPSLGAAADVGLRGFGGEDERDVMLPAAESGRGELSRREVSLGDLGRLGQGSSERSAV